jgi:hypothetical protein
MSETSPKERRSFMKDKVKPEAKEYGTVDVNKSNATSKNKKK